MLAKSYHRLKLLVNTLSISPRFLSFMLIKSPSTVPVKWYDMTNEPKRKHKNGIPKIIWLYWHEEELPNIIKACIKSIKTFCPEYEINILNPISLIDYISLPNITSDVQEANKADLIRLMLLERYGGIWMDASILLTENLNWITNKYDGQDAFLFYSDECTINFKKPISENWLIAAPKGSLFIKEWLNEYKKCILSSEPKIYYNNVKKNRKIIQNITEPDYLLAYISAIIVLNSGNYNILYASSSSVGHYLNYKFNWNPYIISILLLVVDKENLKLPKLIKITGGVRATLNRLSAIGLYYRNSILGQYLGE